ncbi:peptidoglycan DD-metalloendopeptidase family protein [Streptomyces durbertensis]|uniref:Peptidoglycan DD-metalloendopeptidase family protein n=1 Tax=Streptomyces durbertensis TaxID=2448886 RepID=A0ABR6EI58_9ACTN|nr:peptidoglycan DD-metalloendopeptidase family protein [Streptomyces durbertensis]MBB1244843.1 peptidoglycan DD-metalloendopeptidase family protein [Streptomyces durbertensis]
MNDRPPSGSANPSDTAYDASFDGYATTFEGGYPTTAQEPSYDTAATYQQHGADAGYGYPGYDTGAHSTVDTQGQQYPDHGQTHGGTSRPEAGGGFYDTGGYQTSPGIPSQPDHSWAADAYATGADDTTGYAADGPDTGGHPAVNHPTYAPEAFAPGTPDSDAYNSGGYGGGSYDTGAYDTSAYDTGAHHTSGYDTGAHHTSGYDTGAHHTASYGSGGHENAPYESGAYGDTSGAASYGTTSYDTGSYDTGGYDVYDSGAYPTVEYGGPAHGTHEHGDWRSTDDTGSGAAVPAAETTSTWGSGSWDVSALRAEHNTAPAPDEADHSDHTGHPDHTEQGAHSDPTEQAARSHDNSQPGRETDHEPGRESDQGPDHDHSSGFEDPYPSEDTPYELDDTVTPACHTPGGGRASRRRAAKPRRSALLTVAVPSVAVMGVAGIAAASVTGISKDEDKSTQAAPDEGVPVQPSKANRKLDSQLAGVSADAGDFAGRASRTQERIDLKERQEAERKRKEAEAARKEALRPKFALPVRPGLSAYYGQAGINWMSLHTGIDFPVGYGTPVLAATDGVVSTKWDLAYGNMAIVTAADGTQTWYCHLSSTKIRSGPVKAGDTIAYSGNSGNSTGPHLHFEVRPGGGSAVDPVAWFRSKGLDPT